jgi:WD40 repeat protein
VENCNIVFLILMGVNNTSRNGSNQVARALYAFLLVNLLLVGVNAWCYDSEITQFSSATEIDFSPDNLTFLAVDSTNNLVNFWRIDTKALVHSYPATNTPKSAKFSKDGNYIGVGLQNGTIIILTASTYAVSSTLNNPLGGGVVEIDFSWNGNNLIGCASNTIKFMSYSGAVAWTINGFSNIYSCKLNKADGVGVAFNNELQWFLYGANSPTASDQNNGGGNPQYFEVDFSMETGSTAMRLLSGSRDNKIY